MDASDKTEKPQLRMRHSLKVLPTERVLQTGFVLREAVAGDAEGIARVLREAFAEPWPTEMARRELLDHPQVPVTFVVERDKEIIATASYQIQSEPDPEAGWLHWVGVLPSAQGLGLGEIVCRRVLVEAKERQRTGLFLTTDDPRLPAIRTYFKLGFEADCCHASHLGRWEAVRGLLGK
jgi:mycothiol synthase